MNTHNGDLPDNRNENECSATVSIDSLERVEDDIWRSMEEESIRDSLDEPHGNDSNSPSFANLLSSSTVDTCESTRAQPVHPPKSISNDRADDGLLTKTSSSASKTNCLCINLSSATKDSHPRGPADCIETPRPHVNQHSHRKSSHDKLFNSSPSVPTVMRTEAQLTPSGTDQHSRIPIPVRSKTFTSEAHKSDTNVPSSTPDTLSNKGSAASKAGMEVTLSLDVAVAPPRAPTRTCSHHTIERPKKDFVELNKQQEFRRTKTYHSLHLEKFREKIQAQVSAGHTKDANREYVQEPLAHDTAEINISTEPNQEKGDTSKTPTLGSRHQSQKFTPPPSSETSENETASGHGPEGLPSPSSCSTPLSTRQLCDKRRRSRIPVRVRRRSSGGADQFHESRLSYSTGSQSEYELTSPQTRPPAAKHSLIDVNDNRALLLEGSAPCLLESPLPEYRSRGRSSDLILLEEHDTATAPKAAPATSGCVPKAVVTPPNRVIVPPRHVEYTPKLTPYPRKYINMGKLGPDLEAVRQKQEKVRRQQKYADEVSRKNRAGVKKIGYSHQAAPGDKPSATQKMADYAKTIPKPKVKPKSPSPERSSSEGSPMSKIRLLLSGSGSDLTSPRGGAALSSAGGAARRPPPAKGRSTRPLAGHPEPRPVRRPGRGQAQPAPTRDTTPPVAPPAPAGRPPSAGRPRRSTGRSSSLGRARVTSSLHRLRTLTERLVAGEAEAGPARSSLSDDCGARLYRSDTRSTLASEPESEYSTDSLQDAGRPPVVSLGRRRSARSPRGRAQFPPPAGGTARRPGLRCSRAVGPDGPRALAGSTARYPSVEDVFYDILERSGEAWTAESPRRPGVTRGTQVRLQDTFLVPRKDPLVVDIGLPQRGATGGSPRTATRPRTQRDISPDSLCGSPRERAARRDMAATRDEVARRFQAEKRDEAARYDEVAGALADSLCGGLTAGLGVHSPRPRQLPGADLSQLPPPAQSERPPRPASLSESLQRLHERHLRDKQRVDELLTGSLTRF